MRKTILISALALAATAFDISALDIIVSEPGSFKDIMIDTEEDVSTLTISGTMNAADVEYLTGNSGKIAQVKHLIIGDLKLVESETEPYRSFSIFAEASGGLSAKCYYSQNARVDTIGYTTGLGGSAIVYNIYGTDLAGLLARTEFPKITLPASISKVPDLFCFSSKAQEVVLSDNVEEIGKQAFEYCTSLTTINAPSKLKIIGENAFKENWALTSFILPDNPIEIGDYAFALCMNLESINLQNVTSIGEQAFYETIIRTLNLSGASVIGKSAFATCPLKELIVSDKLRVIGDGAFGGPYYWLEPNLMTEVVLYEGLESIGAQAFAGTKLANINIPSTVTYIGARAFSNTDLTNVNIPSSVTYIGEGAFESTPWDRNLASEAVDGIVYLGNIAYKSVNDTENLVFRDGTVSVSANVNMDTAKSVTFPSSIRSIYGSGGSVWESINIESLSLNEGLEIIDGAFFNCPYLKELTLPSTLKYVGGGAFFRAGITSLTLPESLKVIKGAKGNFNDYGTFGESKISSLTLPYGLEEIDEDAFINCSSLSTVRYNSRNLNYTGSSGAAFVRNCEKLVIGANVECIPSYIFNWCLNLARVEFEDSEVPLAIGDEALWGNGETKVKGSIDRVTSIGKTGLYCLSFPNGTHLEMPNLKEIGERAFEDILGVKEMTFHKDMNITATVANNMPDLRIVNFDVPTTNITDPLDRIEYCNLIINWGDAELDSLIIGPNVEIIASGLFYGSRTQNVIFTPRNQTRAASTLSIGERAFNGGKYLTSLDFPPELISLEDEALSSFSNLSTVYFHSKDAPTVGNSAIPMTATVYVPAESEQSYKVNMPSNNVVPYKLESIMFDKSALSLKPGESDYLVPRIAPADCSEMGVIWSSSDPSIATVNDRGEVVGVNFGQATITATIALDNTFKAECVVNVYDPNGVDSIDVENVSPIEEYYTLDGIKIEKPTASGIYIVRHADGSKTKILVK